MGNGSSSGGGSGGSNGVGSCSGGSGSGSFSCSKGGAVLAQWWVHSRSPPTNVAPVRILASAPYVGWFVVGSSPCSDSFLRISGFPLSLKTNTSKFQFDLERTDRFQRVLKNSKVLRG